MRRLIIETDIFSDVDDIGAIAIAHALADRGEIEIAAISVNTPSRWGHRAAAVVNSYFGRPEVPLGVSLPLDESTAENDYARYLAEAFPRHVGPEPRPALEVLREQLAASDDGSAVVASIGFFGNLVELLDSGPDGISELSGRDLVARKVGRTVVMGGRFPRGSEFNVASFPEQARRFVAEWPVQADFLGWEVGADVITGAAVSAQDPTRNPVAAAYLKFTGGAGRKSWDLMAVSIATRGGQGQYWYSEPGRVFVSESGESAWVPEHDGPHRYVVRVASADSVAEPLERLLAAVPAADGITVGG